MSPTTFISRSVNGSDFAKVPTGRGISLVDMIVGGGVTRLSFACDVSRVHCSVGSHSGIGVLYKVYHILS